MNTQTGLRWSSVAWLLLAAALVGLACSELLAGDGTTITTLEAGPHHRRLGVVELVTGADGQAVAVTNTITVLATGLNRFDETINAWVPAQAEFERSADGYVIARRTQHQAILAPDIADVPAVDLLTPDGVRLRSCPAGIAWVDEASGTNLVVAEIRSTPLQLVSSTDALAEDCFEGFKADVRFRLALDGFGADVVLREQPVLPPGFDAETTVLEVLTEFLDPPQPTLRAVGPTADGSADVEIGFGVMAFGCGQTFVVPSESDSSRIPVRKSWQRVDGRTFLVEATPWAALETLVATLPPAAQASVQSTPSPSLRREARVPASFAVPRRSAARVESARAAAPVFREGRLLCPQPVAVFAQSAAPRLHSPLKPGIVLDYTLLQSQTNFTFAGDTTYLVLGTVNLGGTTTFEGGAVVKYTNSTASPQISISGTVLCNTDPYRPVVFTAKDDNTIGGAIPGSSGTPNGYYANPALQIRTSGQTLRHLRFLHAQTGLFLYDYSAGTANSLQHAQFADCATAIQANGYATTFQNLALRNTLIQGATTALTGYSFAAVAEHLTADQCGQLTLDYNGQLYGTTSSLAVTNSVLANVTNLFTGRTVNVSGSYNGFWVAPTFGTPSFTNQTAPFQAAGAGAHYLAVGGNFFDRGTNSINAVLLSDLQQRTACAPLLRTTPISGNTVWGPAAGRDNDGSLDLGYHYAPLDYLCTGLTVGATNATVTLMLTNGTAVGVYGTTGIVLAQDAHVVSDGSATNLNRLVRATSVQELPPSTGWTVGSSDQMIGIDPSATQDSVVRLRFTGLDLPAAGGIVVSSGGQLGTLALTDCQFRGGRLDLTAAGSYPRVVALTNNLFARTPISLGNGSDTTLTAYAWNNLFWHCSPLNLNVATANSWEWRDNLFDTSAIWQYYGGVSNSCNGYVNCPNRMLPTGTGNQTPGPLAYEGGGLGPWYLPASCPQLTDQGSRSASAAGLYHYTTATNQTKETNSTVDIGFHYVALDATNKPFDGDVDGLSDYSEDANGNAVTDSGETDWTNPDTDDDGVTDGQEVLDGTDPLNGQSLVPRRLSYWRFNGTNWTTGEQWQLPTASNNISAVTNFDGTALQLNGAGSKLIYGQNQASGQPNFNLQSGSLRLWFQPTWNLTNMPNGGRLFEVGTYPTWWSVYFANADGHQWLRLGSRASSTNGNNALINQQLDDANNCRSNRLLSWQTTNWHQLAVTWSWPRLWPINLLYSDSYLIWTPHGTTNDPCATNNAPGAGVWRDYGGTGIPATNLPAASVRADGFALGSDRTGGNQAAGLIDEVELFNYPIGDVEQSIRRQWSLTFSVPAGSTGTVLLVRPADPHTNSLPAIDIYRRPAGQTTWSQVAASSTNFTVTDTTLATNTFYEYSLQPAYYTKQVDAAVGLQLAPVHQRGHVILLVATNLVADQNYNLLTELAMLRTNLVGDGWTVTQPLPVPGHNEFIFLSTNYPALNASNRDYITNLIWSARDPATTNVVFIVGHATIPYSGYIARDGHYGRPDIGCHGGPWVCDGYYGVLNKQLWTDSTNVVDTNYTCQVAYPGDGCFDQEYLPPLDMAVGRVDFARMPAFINASFLPSNHRSNTNEVEMELLRQYLVKDARYRSGAMPGGERVCAQFNITGSPSGAARLAGTLYGLEYGKLFNGVPYEQRVPCDWAVFGCYGDPRGQAKDGGGQYFFTTGELADPANEPSVRFYCLWGSWFPDWNVHDDNFLRGLLATPNYGLASLAGLNWGLYRLSLGQPLADAMVHTELLSSFQSIMGDPTLRMVHVSQVGGLAAVRQSPNVLLTWDPQPAAGTRYFVYSSTSGLDGFGQPLQAAGTTSATFVHTNAPSSPLLYQVRVSRLIQTGAGSYWDLGQAAFVSVN